MVGRLSGGTRTVVDEDLAKARRRYLQAAFDWRQAKNRWPTARELARSLVKEFDAEEVWRNLPWPWVDPAGSDQEAVTLMVAGLKECQGTERLLQAFLHVLQSAVERFFTPDVEPQLTLQDVKRIGRLDTTEALQGLEVFKHENLWSGISGHDLAEATFTLNGDLRLLQGVASVDDYLRRRYVERGTTLDLRLREASGAPEGDRTGDGRIEFVPNTAFILMAMDPKNSDHVAAHRALKDAFAEFGIQAQRADDVQHDGVVTDMILGKIRDSEFIVADLTGERPSVYYEIGYAHALGRRVMMFRWRDTRIHFDLAVHNAPSYFDADELKLLLRARLEDRLGRKAAPLSRR